MKHIFYPLLAIYFSLSTLSAQQTVNQSKWCASNDMMDAYFQKHPEMKQKFDAYQAEANAAQKTLENQTQRNAVVNYTIPVVFHVLHQNGSENISDAQIQDQIDLLNRDYNLLNTDTSV